MAKAFRGCLASPRWLQGAWRPDHADAQVDQLFGRLMHCLVAFPAKRNQISLDVVPKCATPSQVVDIKQFDKSLEWLLTGEDRSN